MSGQRPTLLGGGGAWKKHRVETFAFLLSSLWNHSDGGHDSPSGYCCALYTRVEADEYVLLVKSQTSALKDVYVENTVTKTFTKAKIYHNETYLKSCRRSRSLSPTSFVAFVCVRVYMCVRVSVCVRVCVYWMEEGAIRAMADIRHFLLNALHEGWFAFVDIQYLIICFSALNIYNWSIFPVACLSTLPSYTHSPTTQRQTDNTIMEDGRLILLLPHRPTLEHCNTGAMSTDYLTAAILAVTQSDPSPPTCMFDWAFYSTIYVENNGGNNASYLPIHMSNGWQDQFCFHTGKCLHRPVAYREIVYGGILDSNNFVNKIK